MKNTKPRTFDSMKAAAAGMRLSLRVIQAAKSGGCSAFRSNRIYEAELSEWLASNPNIAKQNDGMSLRDRKMLAECIKLETANAARSGRLIERQWMAERVHACAGRVEQFRIKSEAEHPLLFAAAAGDVPACREVIKKIWDEIVLSLGTLESEFRKGPNA